VLQGDIEVVIMRRDELIDACLCIDSRIIATLRKMMSVKISEIVRHIAS
jgi:hypothetical protein